MEIRYLSLCSGIEAASAAWCGLGFIPVAFAEIEAFPSAVLQYHFPNVPNLGDITKINGADYAGAVDLVVGGTPCQGFSVAGKQGGLDDERSGLAREFVRLVSEIKPKLFLWENVPGAFSTNGGRDFREFILALENCGYSIAWRVLDAQFFGVPQRRRRIFLVGCFGDDYRPAAKILFESESLRRTFKKSGTEKHDYSKVTKRRSEKAGGEEITFFTPKIFRPIRTGHSDDKFEAQTYICQTNKPMATLTASAAGMNRPSASGACLDFVVYSLAGNTIGRKEGNGGNGTGVQENISYTLNATDIHSVAYCIKGAGINRSQESDFNSDGIQKELSYTLLAEKQHSIIAENILPRRLTPLECERLQGFPDNWTLVPFKGSLAKDTPRYKAIGNSMAVPVMRWIGIRIKQVMETI